MTATLPPLHERVARPTTGPADALLVDLRCHHCNHQGLTEVAHSTNDGRRRTWTGRCSICHSEAVVIVELVPIHHGDRQFA